MNIQLLEISPAMANSFLANSATKNRSIRPSKVRQYARDMASQSWHLNGGYDQV